MSDCCDFKPNGSYDIAVVGAGSAGFSAATAAAEEGAQVALIGYGTIGGTCINIGCVPSKTLIRAAEILHAARTASRFAGIEASARISDWQPVVRQKQELVDGLRKAKYSDLLPAYNSIAYSQGRASFSDDGALTLDGAKLDTPKIVIATGARPAVPPIAGIEKVPYLTSTTALELETLPSSLLVVGAGYVGAELAQLFARAGVQVTLVCRRGLLPEAEPEIGAALTQYFADEGLQVVSEITYERIEQDNELVRLHVKGQHGPEMFIAEKVLIATGRTPNTEDLNLSDAGIKTNAKNGISVDAQMRTTRDGVYAAGDVTGDDQFVFMAAYGAKIAAKNALNGNSLGYDNSAMPAVVFTDPQVASVGLTEANARAKRLPCKNFRAHA